MNFAKNLKLSTIIFIISSYIVITFLSLHITKTYYSNSEKNIIDVLNLVTKSIEEEPFKISINKNSFKLLFLSLFSLNLFWLYKFATKKNYMPGKEHGTAKWANKTDITKVVDKDFSKNIILTNSELLGLNTRRTRKNLNIVVIGGSGSGKTRYFVKPNLLQMNTSYVCCDPKGEILRSTGKMFRDAGYKIKVFNLVDMNHSSCYNPFKYIREDKDVLKLINNLIKNTTPAGQSGSDPFWEKSETALLQALVYYLYYEGEDSDKNFTMVMELLRSAVVKEDDENHVSDLDLVFQELELKDPDHIALKQYSIFKQAAGKTAKSILVSVGVRLSVFNTDSIKNLTQIDNIEIDRLGDEKTILYIVIPDSDSTYNFLVSILYNQIFDTLYYKADFEYNGRLPVHVRLLLDEFANIGKIPDFEKIIATVRSREISVSVIIQNLAQIKSMYKESWESITGNADSLLFLGGSEQSTLEYFSKAMGKKTIHFKTYGKTRGKNRGSSENENITGRSLMTPDEIGTMPDNKCLLLIKGIRPFLSHKFKLERHKNYPKLGEDGVNEFDYKEIKTEIVDFDFEEKEIDFTDDKTNKNNVEVEYEMEHEDTDDEIDFSDEEDQMDLDEYYEKNYVNQNN